MTAVALHRACKVYGALTAGAVMLFASLSAVVHADDRATLKSVVYEHDNGTEIIRLVFDRRVETKSAVIPASADKSLPVRMYVDFYGAAQRAPNVPPALHPDSGMVKKIRIAQREPSVMRLVCELSQYIKRSSYVVTHAAHEPIVTITIPGVRRYQAQRPSSRRGTRSLTPPLSEGKDHPAASAQHNVGAAEAQRTAAPSVAPAPHTPQPPPSLNAARRQIPSDRCVIVIDPGHGGKDPGAIGAHGIQEKDVCLALGKVLKKQLDREQWCTALLTRSTDSFLSLAQRASFANKNNADFFISLHTNAHDDPSLTGIETYYLDFSSDETARRVAARENFTTPEAIGDLEMILFDLLQSPKINASSILAGYIHNAMVGKLTQRYEHVRNLGVKHAPMRVLIDAGMPCVIIEAAFISNPHEARLLTLPDHQHLLAEAITEGIRSFKATSTFAAMRSRAQGM